MITNKEYSNLQQAYDYFNNLLFANKLPHVLITLQHGKKYYGYYWPEKFVERTDDSSSVGEIALNPDLFEGRTDKEILSTLVHEQVHVWQQTYGEPGRKGYHNKEWGSKMKEIGLYPSNTGKEGGKETGSKMSHYSINPGVFERYCNILLGEGFKLNWQSFIDKKADKKKKQTRVKYCCAGCGLNMWGKPDSNIICEDCSDIEEQVIVKLVPGDLEDKED